VRAIAAGKQYTFLYYYNAIVCDNLDFFYAISCSIFSDIPGDLQTIFVFVLSSDHHNYRGTFSYTFSYFFSLLPPIHQKIYTKNNTIYLQITSLSIRYNQKGTPPAFRSTGNIPFYPEAQRAAGPISIIFYLLSIACQSIIIAVKNKKKTPY
jgi:hypothetical protein